MKEIHQLRTVEERTAGAWYRVDAYWIGTRPNWNDEVREMFGTQHVAPLKEHARQFQVTLHALVEALEDAERSLR